MTAVSVYNKPRTIYCFSTPEGIATFRFNDTGRSSTAIKLCNIIVQSRTLTLFRKGPVCDNLHYSIDSGLSDAEVTLSYA